MAEFDGIELDLREANFLSLLKLQLFEITNSKHLRVPQWWWRQTYITTRPVSSSIEAHECAQDAQNGLRPIASRF